MHFEILGHEYVRDMLQNIPEEVPQRQPIVEFLEENRYIPQSVSKEHFGFFDIRKVPHLREILECLEPDHPATHIAIIKSVQSGITTSVAENAMAYYICNKLGSVLSLTSNLKITKIRGSNIDVMIDNTTGMADMLTMMSDRIKETRRGDTATYKEFLGGIQLLMSSYGSIAAMKSIPYTLIVRDEWCEAPIELKGQGSLDSLIEGRTMATSRYKILSLSTPSQAGTCPMERSFLQGDQREWYVPCPHCGTMQTLVMCDRQQRHGLTFEVERNSSGQQTVIPETVVYNCIGCEKHFYDEHKRQFMAKGEWRPSWTEHPPKTAKHRSYHISGLITPFLTWERICNEYVKTDYGNDLLEYKNFCINILGKAWKNIQERPNWQKFRDRADPYCMGEVPNAGTTGGLILVGGADVHQDRIEFCVCAIGEGMEIWLIEYQKFYFEAFKQQALQESAWQALADYVYDYSHDELGSIHMVAIDARYTPQLRKTQTYIPSEEEGRRTVEEFCGIYFDKFVPVMGDKVHNTPLAQYRKKGKVKGKVLVVQTEELKHVLFEKINETSGKRVVHFPKFHMVEGRREELPDFIYQSFCSEEYSENSKGELRWNQIFKRNEVLDCVVYSLFAAYLLELHRYTKESWQVYRERLEEYKNN